MNKQFNRFRSHFLVRLHSYVQALDLDNSRSQELFFLNLANFICETLSLYRFILHNAKEQASWEAYRDSPYFLSEDSPRVRNLKKGFGGSPSWKVIPRFIKTRIGKRSLRYYPRKLVPQELVGVFSYSPIVDRHLSSDPSKYCLLKYEDWLSRGPVEPASQVPSINASFEYELIEFVRGVFDGLNLSQDIITYFGKSFIEYFFPVTELYLREIEARHKSLPNEVWIGSPGILMSRIVAWSQLKHGKRVVGHDHSICRGGWTKSGFKIWNEFNYVNSFFTFSNALGQGYTGSMEQGGVSNSKFEGIGFPKGEQAILRSKKSISAAGKNVLLVLPYFFKTGSTYDYQFDYKKTSKLLYRCMSNLKKSGFSVYFRPHPLSQLPYHFSFDQVATKMAGMSFEKCLQLADFVIVDSLASTTFIEIFQGDKPLYIFDLDLELYPDAYKQISKRCCFIPTYENRDGELGYDHELLTNEMQSNEILLDYSFMNNYFPFGSPI